MNEDSLTEPETEPKASPQESISKPTNPFDEWPEDKSDSTAEKDLYAPINRGEHLYSWALFWIVTWAGTTLAGGLFGGALGLVGVMHDITAPLSGLFFGSIWAGGMGLFVFFHLGVICWTFWWLDKPLVAASVAGLLTGAFCGVFVFSLLTAPLGALGAYLTGSQLLKTQIGQKFKATIEVAKNNSPGRLKFTTTDLLLRMTVISIVIAGWTAWFKAIY